MLLTLLAALVFAMVTLIQRLTIPSAEALPIFCAIALFCAAVGAIGRYDPFLRTDRRRAAAFASIALLVLAASSVLYLLRLQESSPPTALYAREGEHIGELARLSGEYRYWMDGGLDEWVFVLFKHGLTILDYDQIPIEEQGLLYLFAALLRIAGDFNTYLLVVASCAAQVVSAWLLLRISTRFTPPAAAFSAAALLLAMPDSLYWTSLVHKDNFVVCLVLLCFWSALRAFSGSSPSWRYSVPFVGSLVALAFVRSGLVLPLIGGGLLAIALTRRSPIERAAKYGASIIVGILLVATFVPHPAVNQLQLKVFDRVYHRLSGGSSYKLDVQNIRFRTTAEDSLVYRLSGGDLSLAKCTTCRSALRCTSSRRSRLGRCAASWITSSCGVPGF